MRTTDADLTGWMPEDNLYDHAIFLPYGIPSGYYTLEVGILDRQTNIPAVNLAIEGRAPDSWYPMSMIHAWQVRRIGDRSFVTLL